MGNIDNDDTDNIICPYCDYEHKESRQLLDGWGVYFEGLEYKKIQCENCDKEIEVEIFTTVTYSTKKLGKAGMLPE